MSSSYVATFDNVLVQPLVTQSSYVVSKNTSLVVAGPGVLANDTAVYGSNLVAVLIAGTTNGTLDLKTNGGFTYAPATNNIGTDAFIYQANDGPTNLGVAIVTITITLGLNLQPMILSLKGAGTTNVVISWSAVSNVTYRVQHQASLGGINWFDLVPDVMATNTTATTVDNPNGNPIRFYRIMIVP